MLAARRGRLALRHDGRRYLDMMAAYSAVSFGHCHPALVGVLVEQAGRLAVTSRAFHTDRLGPFLRAVCEITGMDKALPMNTGAEAVETAIKAARKWAYKVKGVPEGRAEIIVSAGNFPGRTTTIIGFSTKRSTATASARSRPASSACRSATPPRSRRRSRRTPRRSWSSRSRARPASSCRRRLSGACARDLHAPPRAAHLRRGADGARPHRRHARLRSRGHPARRPRPRQGARRRPAAGVRVPRDRRSDAGVRARRPRQHVRRQPAGGRGRRGRARRARATSGCPRSARVRGDELLAELRAIDHPAIADVRGKGPADRRRDRSGVRQRARRSAKACSRAACCGRTRTARWSASRRR